eukprot:GILK01000823.1.p1 GENE.GILK01000823.1~~GILK01000823.1.p1  ORF type:complete len:642 (+),score=57.12 GILK01000823.1:57-1982(+)
MSDTRNAWVLFLLCVAFCGLHTLAREFAYTPGDCRADDRQVNAYSCLSLGDSLCEWCNVNSDQITEDKARTMHGARTSEYGDQLKATWMNIKTQVPRRAPRLTPERVKEFEDEYDDKVEDVEQEVLDPKHPRRCTRKWTADACPGKIHFKLSFCEDYWLTIQQAERELEELRSRIRTLTREAAAIYRAKEAEDAAAIRRKKDGVDRFCKENPAKENESYRHRPDDELRALLDSPKHRAEKDPAVVDTQRMQSLLPRYIEKIMKPNPRKVSVGPTLEPDVCHQWSVRATEDSRSSSSRSRELALSKAEAKCYVAGCSWCPFNQRAAGYENYKACQPAWDSNACRISRVVEALLEPLGGGIDKLISKSARFGPFLDLDRREPYILTSLAKKGTFPRPGATAEEMKEWTNDDYVLKGYADAERVRQGPRESIAHDKCKLQHTLLGCLAFHKDCKWCVDPLNSVAPRCSKRWDYAGEFCYEPPIGKDQKEAIQNGVLDAYTAAFSINAVLATEYHRKVAIDTLAMFKEHEMQKSRRAESAREEEASRRRAVVEPEPEDEAEPKDEGERVRLPSLVGRTPQGSGVGSGSSSLRHGSQGASRERSRATPQGLQVLPSYMRATQSSDTRIHRTEVTYGKLKAPRSPGP